MNLSAFTATDTETEKVAITLPTSKQRRCFRNIFKGTAAFSKNNLFSLAGRGDQIKNLK